MNKDLYNTTGFVFNIQRYSIHDGPGIRTTVFLKGCPLRCFWCQNPESQRIQPEMLFRKESCTACGKCVAICSNNAIHIADRFPLTNHAKCTGCGICKDVCFSDARKIEGSMTTVREVMNIVMKDEKHYLKSGGGITLSGGDPVMQATFSVALLEAAKSQGIHTAVETCGHAAWNILEPILRNTDHLFFDIKTIDEEKHFAGTGAGNRKILENARKAARIVKELHIRCPLIPGFNDSPDEVSAIAQFVKDELCLPMSRFTLLRYNKYAEGKYEQLGRQAEVRFMEPQTDQYFEELENIVARYV